jgi:hypothetical protein
MPKPRFTPDLITELRHLVIAHNEAGHERVRLEELKKAYASNHRGRNGHESAMGGVRKLLLRKADEYPRDQKGRFTFGQRRAWGDAASPEQHQQLREDNAGYAAFQNAVIPETRGTQLLPSLLGAAGIVEGAVRGATTGPTWRRNAPSKTIRFMTAPLYGLPFESVQRVRRGINSGFDAVATAGEAVTLAPSRWLVRRGAAERAKIKAQPAPTTLAGKIGRQEKLLRTGAQHRVAAGAAGALLYGVPAAMLYAAGGRVVGPYYDAIKGGRTIEKMHGGDPTARALLQKAMGPQMLFAKAGQIAQRFASAAQAGARAARASGIRRGAAALMPQRPFIRAERLTAQLRGRVGKLGVRRPGLYAAGGAALGAAGAAGAAYGGTKLAERVYYRDKEGQFTSKDKAVITGAAGAAGALIGAALAGRAAGRLNAKAREAVMRRFKGVSTASGMIDGEGRKITVATKARLDSATAALKARGKPLAADEADAAALANTYADAMVTRLSDPKTPRNAIAERVERMAGSAHVQRKFTSPSYQGTVSTIRDAAKKRLDARIAQLQEPWESWYRSQLVEAGRARAQQRLRTTAAKVKGGGFWDGAPNAGALRAETLKKFPARDGAYTLDQVADFLEQKGAKVQAAALRADASALATATKDFDEQLGRAIGARDKARAQADRLTRAAAKAEEKFKAAQTASLDVPRGEKVPAPRLEAKALGDEVWGEVTQVIGNPDASAPAKSVTLNPTIVDALKNAAQTSSAKAAAAEAALARPAIGETAGDHARRIRSALGDDFKEGLPRPRNPFGSGADGFLPMRPTPEDVTKEIAAETARDIAKLHDEIVAEAVKVGEKAGRAARAMPAAMRLLEARPSAARAAVGAVAGAVGSRTTAARRELRNIVAQMRRDVDVDLAGRPQKILDAAERAGAKVADVFAGKKGADGKRAGGVGRWLWQRKGLIALSPVAGAVGLDLGSDGKINLDWARMKAAAQDPKQAALTALTDTHKKGGAYFRLMNAATADEAVITGVTMKTKDGRHLFVSGVVEQTGKPNVSITPGSPVEDVEKRFRKEGGGGQGNQDQSRRLGNADVLKRAEDAANKLAGNLKQEDVGGEKFRHLNLSGLSGGQKDEAEKAASALKGDLNNASAKFASGQPNAEQTYGLLGSVLSGPGRLLSAQEKVDFALKAFGAKGKEARDGLGGNATAQSVNDAIVKLVREAPNPGNDGDATRLRRAARLLGQHLKTQVPLSNYEEIDAAISAKPRSGGGGGQPRQEGQRQGEPRAERAAAAPEPAQAQRSGAAPELREEQRLDVGPGRKYSVLYPAKNPDRWSDDDWIKVTAREIEVQAREILNDAATPRGQKWEQLANTADNNLRASVAGLWSAYRDLINRNYPDASERDQRRALQLYVMQLVGEQAGGVEFEPLRFRPVEKATRAGTLRKDAGGALRRPWDEAKIRRNPGGSDQGGEFASKGGAASHAGAGAKLPGKAEKEERGFFEPVRFGATVGGVLGGQAAWELISRYAPKVKGGLSAKSGRFVVTMLASMAGGAAASKAGERLGAMTYERRGQRAPTPYEEPERPGGEEAARAAGAMIGSFAGAAARSVPGGVLLGGAGQLGGEELMAAAYRVAKNRFGMFA